MSLLRPIDWYHSRADLIWPVGPFNNQVQLFFLKKENLKKHI